MDKLTSKEIIKLALKTRASLAGIANVEDLKKAPAFTVVPKMPKYNGVGTYMRGEKDKFLTEVLWPQGIKSVLILAYHHPIDNPAVDYWIEDHNTIGNKKLISITKDVKSILEKECVETYSFNYHVEKGGIFLKDSAVTAGLGCIGRNNLLVTPEYGPHVRLRALGLSLDLQSTGPSRYDPCKSCKIKCWEKCKKGAFAKEIYFSSELGRNELPGRVGNFDRTLCNIQMEEDVASIKPMNIPEVSTEEPVNVIKYCRTCEYACPIGK